MAPPIINLLKVPPNRPFVVALLKWNDKDLAYYPRDCLQDFVDDEDKGNLHIETTFYIRISKNTSSKNSILVDYIVYLCAYGLALVSD